jgi:hypothetical protein
MDTLQIMQLLAFNFCCFIGLSSGAMKNANVLWLGISATSKTSTLWPDKIHKRYQRILAISDAKQTNYIGRPFPIRMLKAATGVDFS